MNHASRPPTGAGSHVLPLALVALLTGILYAQVRHHGFIDFDDTAYLVDNAVVRDGLSLSGAAWAFTSMYAANWHPLTWLSHMLDVSLFGLEPGPHHLVNAALHCVVGLLLYAVGWCYLRRRDAACVLAVLFVVHPQHVESVVWLAERKDLLCALFYVLALLAYHRYARSPGVFRYLLVAVPFAAALLSKPMAVTLPVVLLLLDAWPLGRLRSRDPGTAARLALEKLPLLLMSLASCAITVIAQQRGGAIADVTALPLADRFANAVLSCALYLRDFVKPDRLGIFYPLRPVDAATQLLPAALALAAVALLAWRLRRSRPALLFGLLWFVLTLLPVIGLVHVGSQARADRYMYIPSMGLMLALAACLPPPAHRACHRRAVAAVVCLAAFWGGLCFLQIGYWENPSVLYARTAEVTGDNPFVENRRIARLIDAGLLEEAGARARALVGNHPENGEALMSMGNVAMVQNRLAEAEQWFRAARRNTPRHAYLLNNLGVVVLRQGRAEEGCRILREAAGIAPELTLVRANIASGACPPG